MAQGLDSKGIALGVLPQGNGFEGRFRGDPSWGFVAARWRVRRGGPGFLFPGPLPQGDVAGTGVRRVRSRLHHDRKIVLPCRFAVARSRSLAGRRRKTMFVQASVARQCSLKSLSQDRDFAEVAAARWRSRKGSLPQ